MTSYILLVAAVILLCLSLNKMSNKLGIPMLLAYILLGMMFGTDGILKIPFDNFTIAEQICTVSLIFIMFYGGFGTNWKQAKPVAGKAVLLSTVGVILTAVTTGAFCHFILRMDFWESMLIGSVISSTDAASVFSILRSKRLNLKNNTASMLEVESGSNDPCSYMLTVIILTIMSGELSGSSLVVMIFSQIIFGILVGVVVALAAAFILKKVNFATDGFDTIFVFSMALVSYAGASMINGNGYLAAYIAGIILGNTPLHHKKSLVHFFDGITGLMQMLIFFLLGLLAYPSQLPKILPIALAIAVFLTFVFHIVIFIVLFSISIQGTLLGLVAKKLDMIDENGNVMKTFSDYSDEMPVEFVKISIKAGHPWENRRIKDLTSLPDLLLVLILRGEERIIPNGNTVVLAGDKIVLSALSPEENLGICLTEIPIEKDSKWIGKPLSRIKLGEEKLVLVLKRNEKVVIPNGNTVIRENDVLVISQL